MPDHRKSGKDSVIKIIMHEMTLRRGEQRVAVESAVNQLIFFSCSSLGVVQWLLCGDGGLTA